MSDCVWLLRHGETEWTEDSRHTGLRDVPLNETGRQQARLAARWLANHPFRHVLVSPQTRARETCELAGFGQGTHVCADLVEWDYGDYEGITDDQARSRYPDWDLFRDGAPGGESPQQVCDRVDRMIERVNGLSGACLVVGHGKLLRALAARWVGAGVEFGSALPMDPAAISVLERKPAGERLRLWNYTGAALDGR